MTFRLVMSMMVMLIGIFGLCTGKTIIKSIISLNIIQSAVILIFLTLASQTGNVIPIFTAGGGNYVDPLPQALMITAIVISASISSLVLMLGNKIFDHFGSYKWTDFINEEEY